MSEVCPICREELAGELAGESAEPACGNGHGVHGRCLRDWRERGESGRDKDSCVVCAAPYPEAALAAVLELGEDADCLDRCVRRRARLCANPPCRLLQWLATGLFLLGWLLVIALRLALGLLRLLLNRLVGLPLLLLLGAAVQLARAALFLALLPLCALHFALFGTRASFERPYRALVAGTQGQLAALCGCARHCLCHVAHIRLQQHIDLTV